ncbi:type I-B CRISPR-associated protein Cas5b [soil metagenome]
MFRKFYTNSSSLSYPFPPRSTLAGLIAGLMGYERDSYSEDLSLEQCKIAVSVKTPVRRVMQTVNYLMTKSPSDFDGSAGGTQIPVEWLFPEINHPKLRYRIYVTHENIEWLENLNTLFTTNTWIYPPYLGMSECLAQVAHVATVSNWTLERPEKAKLLATVVPVQALEGAPELIPGSQIIKERIPLALDRDRRLKVICDVLYERTNKGVTARLNRPAFHVTYEVQGTPTDEVGVFLE